MLFSAPASRRTLIVALVAAMLLPVELIAAHLIAVLIVG